VSAQSIKVGDTVQLNSGGPPLTVTEVKTAIKVAWITPDGERSEAFFPAECLVSCTPLREQPQFRADYSNGTANRYPPINFSVSMGGEGNDQAY
jgi:uncharacterized protein YodC (DUF2158 family)